MFLRERAGGRLPPPHTREFSPTPHPTPEKEVAVRGEGVGGEGSWAQIRHSLPSHMRVHLPGTVRDRVADFPATTSAMRRATFPIG
jgi:hypothetical protein